MTKSAEDIQRAIFSRVNRAVRPLVKLGVGSPLPVGLGAVVLEHTGRVSGDTYEAPLFGLRVGDRVYVSTIRERSQWLKNLEADSDAGVWFCGARHDATASVERGRLNVVELRTGTESDAE
ncbi:MAG: nitroreductase/quinone reductase family protein [Actinomycetota bacterium]